MDSRQSDVEELLNKINIFNSDGYAYASDVIQALVNSYNIPESNSEVQNILKSNIDPNGTNPLISKPQLIKFITGFICNDNEGDVVRSQVEEVCSGYSKGSGAQSLTIKDEYIVQKNNDDVASHSSSDYLPGLNSTLDLVRQKNQTIERLKDQLQDVEHDSLGFEKALTASEKQIKLLEQTALSSAQEIHSLKEELEQIKKNYEETEINLRLNLSSCKKELKEWKDNYYRLEKDWQTSNCKHEKIIRNLEIEKQRLEMELDRAAEYRANKENEVGLLRGTIENLDNEVLRLETEIQVLKTQLESSSVPEIDDQPNIREELGELTRHWEDCDDLISGSTSLENSTVHISRQCSEDLSILPLPSPMALWDELSLVERYHPEPIHFPSAVKTDPIIQTTQIENLSQVVTKANRKLFMAVLFTMLFASNYSVFVLILKKFFGTNHHKIAF